MDFVDKIMTPIFWFLVAYATWHSITLISDPNAVLWHAYFAVIAPFFMIAFNSFCEDFSKGLIKK